MNEDVRPQKDALENLNTRKSTSRRILTGILSKNSKNSEFKPNFRFKISESGKQLQNTGPYFKVLNRSGSVARVLDWINMSKIHDC